MWDNSVTDRGDTDISPYEKIFSEISDLNPTHLETLALKIHPTLNGISRARLIQIARFAETKGSVWLKTLHDSAVVA